MTTAEIVSIILVLMLFLSGFIPIVMGIIYYARDNQRLDKEYKEKLRRGASRQSV